MVCRSMHGKINLIIDDRFPWKDSWLGPLAEVFAGETSDCATVDVEVRYIRTLPTQNMRRLDESIFIREGAITDRKYGISLERTQHGGFLLYVDNPSLEWMHWILQVAFLLAKVSLVHAACVERNDKAIVFPSWGGVGKTAIVTRFVRDKGYRFMGDDLVGMCASGSCYAMPKPMVLYGYHRSLFPEVFAKSRPVVPSFLNRPLDSLGGVMKPLLRRVPDVLEFARKHNPQSIKVYPSTVFGERQFTTSAQVEAIVWLERVKEKSSSGLRSCSVMEMVSKIVAGTITNYDPRCVFITNIAMGLGIISMQDLYLRWNVILDHCASKSHLSILSIPVDVGINTVSDYVHRALSENGICAM